MAVVRIMRWDGNGFVIWIVKCGDFGKWTKEGFIVLFVCEKVAAYL